MNAIQEKTKRSVNFVQKRRATVSGDTRRTARKAEASLDGTRLVINAA